MTKDHLYIACYFVSLIAFLITMGNGMSVFVLTLIFFASTMAMTFRLTTIEKEQEVSKVYTPVRYIHRQSSFSPENFLRAFVMVLAALLFVYSKQYWILILIPAWTICAGVSAYTIYLNHLYQQMSLIAMGMWFEYKLYFSRSEIVTIVSILDAMHPKAVLSSENGIIDKQLDKSKRKEFLNYYLKLRREINSDE